MLESNIWKNLKSPKEKNKIPLANTACSSILIFDMVIEWKVIQKRRNWNHVRNYHAEYLFSLLSLIPDRKKSIIKGEHTLN